MTDNSEAQVIQLKAILVVDDDQQRAERFTHLLDFLDYQPQYCAWADFVSSELTEKSYLAIFIADGDGVRERAAALVKSLGYNPGLVLLMDEDVFAAQVGAMEDCFIGRTQFHCKYSELNSLLHRAEINARSRDRSQSDSYKLYRSLVGNSRPMRHVRKLIEQVAGTDATVLITGESGTGKEVIARNVHYFSARRDKPFVPINCGAIPADLLESELFGHEKGAFTGAISARQGRFELAEGGTIFLDEIGDMPLPMQVKLLRVLQERCFERVGSNRSIPTDVRIIAATHRDLEQQIEVGKFREDLYYRLNVFPIHAATLRDRLEDMHLLVAELINRLEHSNVGSVRLTPSAIMALCHYRWPGNVRELANVIERLAILYPYGVVDVKDLPEKLIPEHLAQEIHDVDGAEAVSSGGLPAGLTTLSDLRLPREGLDLKEHLTHIEVSLIHQALDDADGVVAHAANRLGMRRTTLVEKMRKYGIQRPDDASED